MVDHGYPRGYIGAVTHTVASKHKILARVRKLRGQVEAMERAVDKEAGCDEIVHLIAAIRGAAAGLMAEILEGHVRTHLVDEKRHPDVLNGAAADQLVKVIRTYLR